jgi:hypothetical protein
MRDTGALYAACHLRVSRAAGHAGGDPQGAKTSNYAKAQDCAHFQPEGQ